MKGKLVALVLPLSVLVGGCPATPAEKLEERLDELYEARVAALEKGQSSARADGDLVALAKNASARARDTPDPRQRAALYRVAAMAAWQAGEKGESLMPAIMDAGLAVCEAFPSGDKGAPQDCSLIRLAAPLDAQDRLARQLSAFQRQLAVSASGVLPAADLAPIQRLFDGFEMQLAQVSRIRDGMHRLDVPDGLKIQTDTQRLIIYCNAVKAWSLTADVDGTPMADFTAMGQRTKKMAAVLEADGVAPDCAAAPGMQTSDTGPS